MRARWLMAALALLFVAQAATAQVEDVTDERVAILVAAIESVGCVVNEANEGSVLAAAGMTEAEAGAIVILLMTTGRAEPFGDDLKLTTGNCN